MKKVHQIRIAVGYPSDAAPMRKLFERIMQEPEFKAVEQALPCVLEIVAWDTHAGPGIHECGAQGWIDRRLKIEEADLFVALFYQKLGTPYAKGDRKYPSGTAYEMESAISHWSIHGSPDVWLVFPEHFLLDDGGVVEPSKQLSEYIEAVSQQPGEYGLLQLRYSGLGQLEYELRRNLMAFVINRTNRIADAVAVPAPTTLFYSISSTPVLVPAEGLTGLLGDLEIVLFATSDRRDEVWWHGRVFVYVNTNITSPVEAGLSTSVLTVESKEENSGRWVKTGRICGRQIGANSLSFDVSVHFPQRPWNARLVVSNLLANASQLGVSLSSPAFVVASVSVVSFDNDRFAIQAGNIQSQVAVVRPILKVGRFELDGASPEPVVSDDWGGYRKIRWPVSLEAVSTREVEAAIKAADKFSGGGGFHLFFRFSGLAGAEKFFARKVVAANLAGWEWRCALADARGARTPMFESPPEIDLRNLRVCGLAIAGGNASAVYVLRPTSGPKQVDQQSETFEFFIGQTSSSEREYIVLEGACSLGPLSSNTAASATEPVPRFADTSGRQAVTIRWL